MSVSRFWVIRHCRQIILGLGVVVALTATAHAQSTWTGSNSGNWSLGTNWNPSGVPASGQNLQLTFGAAVNSAMTDDIGGTFIVNSITFLSGDAAYSLTGNAIAFQTNSSSVTPVIAMNSDNGFTVGNNVTLTNNLTVNGSGHGTVALNGNLSGAGGITYAGAGTLVLGGTNTFTNSLSVSSGTLALTNGRAIPTGQNVFLASAALTLGSISNTAATAMGTLTLTNSTLVIPSGSGDYYMSRLIINGGNIDFTGSTNFGMHLTGLAGIQVNSGNADTWTGGTGSHIQNDSGNTFNLAVAVPLTVGVALTGSPFNITSNSFSPVRLSNTGNTAGLVATACLLQTNDMSTDVGAGANGTLGTGTLTIAGGTLAYDGSTAASAKGFTISTGGAAIQVVNAGTNLTINGAIGQSASGESLFVQGTGVTGSPSTLTLTNGTSNYTGVTTVSGQAILAIPTIANGGAASPIGAATNASANLVLGSTANGITGGRGDLLYTGPTASTDRGATVVGLYASNQGGAIGVSTASTNLTWGGVITGSGTFIKSGAGTLTLNAANTYTGGTVVEGGTLALGNGNAIPTGGNVTLNSGAALNIGVVSNTSATAIGTLTTNSATISVPGGSGNYYLSNLAMTNGGLDFTGSTNFGLHFVGSSPTITINAGTTTWTGSAASHVQNDGSTGLQVNLNSGAVLNVGANLAPGIGIQLISFNGSGTVRLLNAGNTAPMSVSATLITNDLSTNSGSGAFGTLGTGAIDLYTPGTLAYDGPTAASDKSIQVDAANGAGIQVINPGANLTINGLIHQSGLVAGLTVTGSGIAGSPSTLTLTAANTYQGPTTVVGSGILAVPTIGFAGSGGTASPLGESSNAAGNLVLGDASKGRGDLLLTGTNGTYNTDRGVTVQGLYGSNGGGAIGVQNAGTTLTWNGPITGPGTLIKTGAGTLVLAANNSYAGGLFIEGGIVTNGLASPSAVPAGSNVMVFAGGEFNTGGVSGNAIPASINLLGGTLQVLTFSGYLAGSLTLTGGTVTSLPGDFAAFYLTSPSGIVCNASSVTSTVTFPAGGGNGVHNNSGGPMSIQIAAGTAPTGVDLDLFAALIRLGNNQPFVKTGVGVLRLNDSATNADLVVNQGKLRVDALAALGTGGLSLTGGTFLYGGATASTAKAITLDQGLSGIEVMQAGTTLTLTTPLTGNGGLAIRGAGTLVLPAGSTYGGGTVIDGMTYLAASDSAFGIASGAMSVINGGLLQYTASSSTARTYTLDSGGTVAVAAGQTLTLNGARVNGGFLAGPGTFAATGGTVLTGGTTYSSTPVSVTGAASFVNFSNGGPLTSAAGLTSPVAFTRFINQGSGAVTVGATSPLSVSDFQTYGTLTINPATVSENYSQTTKVTNIGTSPLYFNGGSRTIVGTPETAVFPVGSPQAGQPTFVAGIDLNGKDAIVAGGLFVNNGYVEDSSNGFAGTGTVVADFGSLVKGAGFFQNTVVTQNGGKFQPGNSPGLASFGKFVLGPGGVDNYVFAIDDATGGAGPLPDSAGHVSGWGLVKAISGVGGLTTMPGDFVWTATAADKLTFAIQTLLNPTTVGVDVPGLMDHFDPSRSYQWPAVEWTGSYSGPADDGTLDAATAFDTAGFANPVAGRFGWSLDAADNTLSLTYTPTAVPEPGTLTLAGLAAVGWVRFWRRRCRAETAP
jgi:autotransporter-associated beta strand protein